jgi:hypothetical protein
MRDALSRAAALGLDAALFSSSAATTDQPAGLLNGVTPVTASSASVLMDAMLSDLSALAGSVARVAGTSGIVFVAAPEQAVAIAVGAPTFQFPVLATSTLPKGTAICVASNAIVSASDPLPTIEAGREIAWHRESGTPAEIVSGSGTVASPVMSSFQTDVVGLRLRLPLSWAVRAPAAVAFTQNVIW